MNTITGPSIEVWKRTVKGFRRAEKEFDAIKRQIITLEEKLSCIEGKQAELRERHILLEDENHNEIAALQKAIDSLCQTESLLKRELITLEKRCKKLEEAEDRNKRMIAALQEELKKLSALVAGLTNQRVERVETLLPSAEEVQGDRRHINETRSDENIIVGVLSAKGIVPSKNDDFGVAFSNGKSAAVCVCDGVGSSLNGGKCARRAACSVLDFLRAISDDEEVDTKELLQKLFDRAKEAVAGIENGESTMIASVMDITSGKLSLGWLGDGTALHISKDGVREILRPHHNEMHELTKFLSGDGRNDREPEIEEMTLKQDEVVLIASDGFGDFELDYNVLRSTILKAINLHIPAEQVCAKLVKDAIDADADDNITVALIGLSSRVTEEIKGKTSKKSG